MINIELLRMLNETDSINNKKLNLSCEKNEIIETLLKDDAVFFKILKDDAYLILRKLNVPEEKLYISYMSMISYEEYQRLIDKGLMKKDEVIINVDELYNTDVFKSKADDTSENALVKVEHKKESIYEKILKVFRNLMKKS